MTLLETINDILDKKFGPNFADSLKNNPKERIRAAFDKIRRSEMGAFRYWLYLNPTASHEDIIKCLDTKTYRNIRRQRALADQEAGHKIDYYFLHNR